MQDILKKKPVSPDKLNNSVPPALAAIVMKALEKKPESRFTDAKLFQLALANAFPAAREADITYLFSNAVVPLTTYGNTRATGTREAVRPAALSNLRPAYLLRMLNLPALLNFRALSRINVFGQLNKRNAFLAIAILVIVTVTAALVITKTDDVTVDPIASSDSTQVKPVTPTDNVQPLIPQVDQSSGADSSTRGPVVVDMTGGTKEEEKTTDKPAEKKTEPAKKTEKTEKTEPAPAPTPVIPEKEPEKVSPVEEPKPKPSGSVTLGGRTEVTLYLREPLTESSQTGQVLSFSVVNPVVYDGKLIVERGSAASGRIKNVGNKKITVVLQSVVGINGQRLPLQEIELSGRTNEMISNRSYSAYFKKGTIINF